MTNRSGPFNTAIRSGSFDVEQKEVSLEGLKKNMDAELIKYRLAIQQAKDMIRILESDEIVIQKRIESLKNDADELSKRNEASIKEAILKVDNLRSKLADDRKDFEGQKKKIEYGFIERETKIQEIEESLSVRDATLDQREEQLIKNRNEAENEKNALCSAWIEINGRKSECDKIEDANKVREENLTALANRIEERRAEAKARQDSLSAQRNIFEEARIKLSHEKEEFYLLKRDAEELMKQAKELQKTVQTIQQDALEKIASAKQMAEQNQEKERSLLEIESALVKQKESLDKQQAILNKLRANP